MGRPYQSLGDYLRRRRLASGLSQMDVARTLGYASAQFISNWERGLCYPPLDTLYKLIPIYALKQETLLRLMLEDTKRNLTEDFIEHGLIQRKLKSGRG